MIDEPALVAMFEQLQADALRRWVDNGWVLPRDAGPSLQFDDSDVARVRLIYELHYEMNIEEDSMPVVLSLLDQLYGARRSLRALMAAVAAEPQDVRDRIAGVVRRQHSAQ